MSETHKRRAGRPTKEAVPGKKVSLGLKVTPTIKDQLDRAARASGRTQSQEAEYRLEQTFDKRPLVIAMELAFGAELAAALIAAGEAMRGADQYSFALGGEEPWRYEQVLAAAMTVFEAFRPMGQPVQPELRGSTAKGMVGKLGPGRSIALQRLLSFLDRDTADLVRDLLGEKAAAAMASRIRQIINDLGYDVASRTVLVELAPDLPASDT